MLHMTDTDINTHLPQPIKYIHTVIIYTYDDELWE